MVTSKRSTTHNQSRLASRWLVLLAMLASSSLTGCTALFSPIDTIPADRVPPQFLAEPQANKVPLDPARLRQQQPEFYTLDSDDVLAVFVENVLGSTDEPPPVTIPDPQSDLPPATGYPVPVREDGTVALPLIDPIPVRGLTIQQAEALIERAYRGGPEPLVTEKARIIVGILKERTYRVFVVRQDNSFSQRGSQFLGQRQGGQVFDRSDQSSRGYVLQMPAYKNDVLNALLQTGGVPGVNAKPEIRILRGDRLKIAQRDAQKEEFYRTNKPGEFPYGQLPNVADATNELKIPLRLKPGEVPTFLEEDIILRDGDVVYVDTRETDVYYTAGLLPGGEFPLPRDYDLDVLSAIALSGGSNLGASQRTGLLGGAAQNVAPTELIVLRRIPGDRQLAIRVDLNDTLNNPAERLLIKRGDTLILRYKPQEELLNFTSNIFFTFGIRELFR